SDGVFAIVITLLVIEIHAPNEGEVEQSGSLAAALFEQWPSYAGYFVSFLIIGVMWVNHHRIFEQVRAVDGPTLLLNLNLLLWTVLIPFPTAVMAEYLRQGGDDATTAVALYTGLILVTAVSFTLLFAWVTHDARLIAEVPSPAAIRAARIRFSFGLAAYTLAFAMSWLAPVVALVAHAAMALYYAFDQASVASASA
ncbi:MAG: TMEM175 family protein, partial [Acidimicrobiales bacterium]